MLGKVFSCFARFAIVNGHNQWESFQVRAQSGDFQGHGEINATLDKIVTALVVGKSCWLRFDRPASLDSHLRQYPLCTHL